MLDSSKDLLSRQRLEVLAESRRASPHSNKRPNDRFGVSIR